MLCLLVLVYADAKSRDCISARSCSQDSKWEEKDTLVLEFAVTRLTQLFDRTRRALPMRHFGGARPSAPAVSGPRLSAAAPARSGRRRCTTAGVGGCHQTGEFG